MPSMRWVEKGKEKRGDKVFKGQSIAEYGLVVVLVGVATIGSLTFLGNTISAGFDNLATSVGGGAPPSVVNDGGTSADDGSADSGDDGILANAGADNDGGATESSDAAVNGGEDGAGDGDTTVTCVGFGCP
jgi:Flp pilus assembly pilin Flp